MKEYCLGLKCEDECERLQLHFMWCDQFNEECYMENDMKIIKPYDYSYEGPDGLARTHCYGTKETWVQLDEGEFVARWEKCNICHGEGHNIFRRCSYCNGTGRVAVPVEVGK